MYQGQYIDTLYDKKIEDSGTALLEMLQKKVESRKKWKEEYF